MKNLSLAAVFAAVFSTTATAGSVQLDMTFTMTDFRFVVDALWMDPDDAFHYDATAASTELQQHFDGSKAFGGATWDGAERVWYLDPADFNFDTATVSLIFDDNDFLKSNVTGGLVPTGSIILQNSYGSAVDVAVSKSGSPVGGQSFSGHETISGDQVSLGDYGTGDLLGFLVNTGDPDLALNTVFGAPLGTKDWLDLVPGGTSALDYALTTSGFDGFLLLEEEIDALDGSDIGRLDFEGLLTSYSISTPSGGGTVPVPAPVPALLLLSGLAGLGLLRRARG